MTMLAKKFIVANLVNREYEGELTANGAIVRVRTLGDVTVSPYVVGTPITIQTLAASDESMQVNTARYFAFEVDDVEQAQSDIRIMDPYAAKGAAALNAQSETLLMEQYAKAHIDNRITGAAAANITTWTTAGIYDAFVDARTRLSKKDVPMEGRWAIVSPDDVALIERSPEFRNAGQLGNATITTGLIGASATEYRRGLVGQLQGFDVYESNYVTTLAGSRYPMFGTRNAITYAAGIFKVEAMRRETQFSDLVRGLMMHGAHVFGETSKQLGYWKVPA